VESCFNKRQVLFLVVKTAKCKRSIKELPIPLQKLARKKNLKRRQAKKNSKKARRHHSLIIPLISFEVEFEKPILF